MGVGEQPVGQLGHLPPAHLLPPPVGQMLRWAGFVHLLLPWRHASDMLSSTLCECYYFSFCLLRSSLPFSPCYRDYFVESGF